jgi:hypothetical protein
MKSPHTKNSECPPCRDDEAEAPRRQHGVVSSEEKGWDGTLRVALDRSLCSHVVVGPKPPMPSIVSNSYTSACNGDEGLNEAGG